jgi:cytochrome c oxidase cbb3-type subunit III
MKRAAAWALVAASGLFAADTGEHLYRVHCAPCHGPNGEGGRGPTLAVNKLPRAPDDAALSKIITLGIAGTQMPGTRMTADENRQLAAYVRTLGHAQPPQAPGDRANGERLFWSKGYCGRCHTVGPNGGRLGPDLSEIGVRRGPANLRQSILDPQAEIPDTFAVYRRVISMPDNFLQVRVQTKDRRWVTGVRIDEDAFTIQIRDDSDRIYSFRKEELLTLSKEWGKSPMPGYREVFSDSEIQDLVAYLSSLRGGS